MPGNAGETVLALRVKTINPVRKAMHFDYKDLLEGEVC
jgi:hypothetical protein